MKSPTIPTERYDGLVVRAKNGSLWRWLGCAVVENARGKPVRVERVQRPCRACGAPFEALIKLPREVRRRYLAQRSRSPAGEPIELALPADRRLSGVELVNCERHRGWGAPHPVLERMRLEREHADLV